VERVAACLRVSPGCHAVREAAAWVGGFDRRQLEALGVAIVLYGLLYVAQSVGVLLRRRWGSYLVIVSSGVFIPVEAYELVEKVNASRFALLAVNVGIVLYLVDKLRHGQGRCPDRVGGATPVPS
jgi:uncharacterized membrane protein (DUF2068 family)